MTCTVQVLSAEACSTINKLVSVQTQQRMVRATSDWCIQQSVWRALTITTNTQCSDLPNLIDCLFKVGVTFATFSGLWHGASCFVSFLYLLSVCVVMGSTSVLNNQSLVFIPRLPTRCGIYRKDNASNTYLAQAHKHRDLALCKHRPQIGCDGVGNNAVKETFTF